MSFASAYLYTCTVLTCNVFWWYINGQKKPTNSTVSSELSQSPQFNMKVFVFAALVAVVAAGGYPQPQHGYKEEKSYMGSSYSAPHYSAPAPQYKENKPAYHQPEYKSADYDKKSYDVPSPYHFDWAVKDDYTYNNFGQQESSDGKGYVSGSYYTLLPDGRTQIVNYKADDYSGYVADVKYEGYAKYPEYTPSGSYYKTPSYPEYNKAPAVKYEKPYAAAKY